MLFLEILIVLILILLNGLFAMSELALVSSRKSRMAFLARQGSRGAQSALHLMDNPSRFLSTIQIGITFIGIIAGAFSGVTLGSRLGDWLNSFLFLSPHGETIGIGLTVAIITYLSLLIGELVPKRIALTRPEKISAAVAGPMSRLAWLATPAVWILDISIKKVMKILGLSAARETGVTEDEVKSLIAEGAQTGVFVPQEQKMIEAVLRLADRPVEVIMTPRSKIIWISADTGRDILIKTIESKQVSRLLVCERDLDHPLGAVHTKALLPEALRSSKLAVTSLMTPLLFIPEQTRVLTLLNRFKKEKLHMAVVVDEHGITQGLVTLTDVLESIAGDLPERGEKSEPRIVKRKDGSWLIDGTAPTDEVETATGVKLGPEVTTMAGFILHQLGQIPESGMSFEYGGMFFEVVDMDGLRIDKVLVTPKPADNQ